MKYIIYIYVGSISNMKYIIYIYVHKAEASMCC